MSHSRKRQVGKTLSETIVLILKGESSMTMGGILGKTPVGVSKRHVAEAVGELLSAGAVERTQGRDNNEFIRLVCSMKHRVNTRRWDSGVLA